MSSWKSFECWNWGSCNPAFVIRRISSLEFELIIILNWIKNWILFLICRELWSQGIDAFFSCREGPVCCLPGFLGSSSCIDFLFFIFYFIPFLFSLVHYDCCWCWMKSGGRYCCAIQGKGMMVSTRLLLFLHWYARRPGVVDVVCSLVYY